MSESNHVFLKALKREPVPYTPVWMMRQAGRYLPEYNATRARAGSFMGLCKNPDFCTEVTLQPLDRYPLDAAILFSDILTIPDAMGLELTFSEGEGPRFCHPLQDEASILKTKAPDPDCLKFVMDAVSMIRKALQNRVPLIGFSGSPFTLACYMIEGRGNTDFCLARSLLYRRPDLMHYLLQVNTEAITTYLQGQISCGAQAIMIFDTWGGLLTEPNYLTFSLAYLHKIIQAVQSHENTSKIPIILYTKGGGAWLEAMSTTGADCLGLDWTLPLSQARKRVGHQVALQGNLDPMVLLSSPTIIESHVSNILAEFGIGNGHIFNLGHGIDRHTPPEHAAVLIDAVHRLSIPYHHKT
ncbi:MAG: uroporphyrinogen decarboxylase [Proteobacteria bacterium]|nr:uroporphyrinogen decarboxylase [Pseudomonadota bacterium]MDE3209068.1 uroporphyrinogen decarboxylase [Pseudomonadota bacterium]